MMTKQDLKKISPWLWEIPAGYQSRMTVPCRIFASDKMIDDLFRDRSLEQLIQVAMLPGLLDAAIVMPDAHEGYGFPIGGVAATTFPDGVLSPGGIGYDINCGVSLLRSEHTLEEMGRHIRALGEQMYRTIPSGTGKTGFIGISAGELDKVLEQGVPRMVRMGYGDPDDPLVFESGGCLENADADAVSALAKKRGIDQLGTLGSGNHFVEIGVVDQVFDPKTAEAFGLFEGQLTILVHSGSRGLGHQVATDYIRILMQAMSRYGISVPDRELACVPLSTPEGQAYFAAMAAAANFAWSNRLGIVHFIRKAWDQVLGSQAGRLSVLYDVTHNIAKVESVTRTDGNTQKAIVHRKGATRAFGPDHPDIPALYRSYGQPVIIPGSMGTASYVLAGTKESQHLSFSSCCHGAGRHLSRHAALQATRGEAVMRELAGRGIIIRTGSLSGLAEEAPIAYKDVDEVVNVVQAARLARKVTRLRPVMVIKG